MPATFSVPARRFVHGRRPRKEAPIECRGVQRAPRSLGGHAFCARKSQQLAADGIDIDPELAHGLHRVHMETDPSFTGIRPISSTGCKTPVSLLAIITQINLVLGRARRTSPAATTPCPSTGRNSTSTPRSPSLSTACSTAWCSTVLVIT